MIIMSLENAFEEGAVTSNAKLKDTFVKVEIQSEPDNPIELDSQGKTSDQQASYESIEASIESLLEAPVENILMAEAAADPNGVDLEDEADGSADDGLNTGTFGQLENSMSIANSESQGRDRSKTVYDEHEMRSWVNHRSNSCSANMDSNEPERHRTIQFLEPIVTGSMEAKYFERGDSVSKDDLIQLYKVSCEQNRTKPLNSVISCIDKAKNLDERIKELSLKGEKLDGRVADSLEIVFRHAQFVILDLENCYLEDTVAIALFEMIDYYEVATKLKLGANNRLSQFAWMHLCQMIKKCPFVDLLDCSYTEMGDSGAILLARLLRNNCNLHSLHLMNCRMSGKFLNYLVVGLRSNYILQELYLGDNALIHSDAALLSQLLKSNFKLQCLDLRNNNLGDKGAASIFEGLREQGQTGVGLTSLILWNNNLSPNCHYVIHPLAVHRSLETLNMGYNDLRNEGVALLKDGLMRNKSIARLGLSSTRIDSIGAIAMAEYIAESTSIVRVDIRNNNVKVAGIMALQNALKNNYTLTRLDLDQQPKKEQLYGYTELYGKSLEQILFLLERNQTLSSEEDTRRYVLQQQMLTYTKGLASSKAKNNQIIPSTPQTNQISLGQTTLSSSRTSMISQNKHHVMNGVAMDGGGGGGGELREQRIRQFSETLTIQPPSSKDSDIPIILPPLSTNHDSSLSEASVNSPQGSGDTKPNPLVEQLELSSSGVEEDLDSPSVVPFSPPPPLSLSPDTKQKFQNIPHISIISSSSSKMTSAVSTDNKDEIASSNVNSVESSEDKEDQKEYSSSGSLPEEEEQESSRSLESSTSRSSGTTEDTVPGITLGNLRESGLSTWNPKNNSDKISIRRDSTTEKTASASDLDEVSTSSENVEGSKEPHSTAFDVPGDR